MVEDIVLVNLETGEELALSMDDTPNYILWNVDWGSVESDVSTSKFYKQLGETVENVSVGTRAITIVGWIVAANAAEMSDLKRRIDTFVNPQQPLEMQYLHYKLIVYPDKSLQYSKEWEENNDAMVKFQITGTAYDPLFSLQSDMQVDAHVPEPKFIFPFYIPLEPDPPGAFVFGIRNESDFFTINNAGSVEVGMRVVFKANGALSNPSITNIVTNEIIKINKVLEANEEVEVCTEIGNKSVKGRKIVDGKFEEYDYFTYKDFDSSWIQLRRGDNTFKFAADSGVEDLDIYAYFTPKLMEVEECY